MSGAVTTTGTEAPAAEERRSQPTLLRLLTYITRQRLRLAVAVVLLISGSAVMAAQPLLFGRAVDELASGNASHAGGYAIAIIAVAIIASVFNYISFRQLAILAQRGMLLLRKELFAKMQTLSLSFFDKESSGDLNARVTSDIEAVNLFFSNALARVISVAVAVITMIVIMFTLDPLMALVVLLIVPATLSVMLGLGRRVQGDFTTYQAKVGELNGVIEESIKGHRALQAYVGEQAALARVTELSEQARVVDRSAQFRAYLMQPANQLVNNLDVALVALIGGWRALSGSISVGDVVSFIGYGQQFGGQMGQLAQVVTQVFQATAGARRVFSILDLEPEIKDRPDAEPMPKSEGRVDFNHVDFRYNERQQILFDNDFHVEPGQMIGLVGRTGAGKSTIINLLTRFYDIEGGDILLDGREIVGIPLRDLRRRVSVVLQVPFLFSESVMYNLMYGREGATEEECIEAAKQVDAHDFISCLPQGYDTVLTGGGEALSQGQRQLLTIARAIVADPDVLVLDEATSSVDTRTEQHIQRALDTLMAGRTSFVIAHRLSTVRNADAIIVLDHGRILEMDSHDRLIANHGPYYEMYRQQFRPEMAAALREQAEVAPEE